MSEKAQQNAPERCSCCTCGYTWVKGQHGGHSCAQVMEVTVADLRARLAKYEDAEGRPLQSGVVDERAAFEAAYVAEFKRERNERFTVEMMVSMREGDHYGNRPYVNGQWKGWQARAALKDSAPTYRTYTTTPGEAVAGISLRQLGDESRWVEVRDLNAHAFPDIGPHDYYPVGTELRLPALSAPNHSEQVPEGWKLVPVEPTPEMISAASGAITTPDDLPPIGVGGWSMSDLAFRSRYRAALAAAPSAGNHGGDV